VCPDYGVFNSLAGDELVDSGGPACRWRRRGMTQLMHPLAASHRIEGSSGEIFVGVHGFTGTPAHLRLLGEHINNVHGHTVLLPRLAGHGTSLEDMATTGRHHWLGSVSDALQIAFGLGERVHLFGFSMGGLLAVRAAAAFPVATLSTLNTPTVSTNPPVHVARFVAPFRKYRMWPEGGEEPAADAARYWVHYDGMPTASILQVAKLRNEALAVAPSVTAPTLVIQSKADETVRAESAGRLAHALAEAEVSVTWLERSPHNALLLDERSVIHAAISAHLRESGSGAI